MQVEIFILIFSVGLSGFFSGIEAAFFSVTNVDIKRNIREKHKNAKILQNLKKDPHRFIITDLIGNNVVNIFSAALATKIALDTYGDVGIGIATGLMTIVVLIFGEIVPKAYCAKKANSISLFAAPIIHFLSILLKPIIIILQFITKVLLRSVGVENSHIERKITEQEIKDMITIGKEGGALTKVETEYLENILEFNDTIVNEILTPKENVDSATITDNPTKVLKQMNQTGYSRLPVFDSAKDHVVGVIYIKDIINDILQKKTSPTIEKLMKDPYVIPDTKKIVRLLKAFQKEQIHIAVVVNEYGGFTGIITLEDVLEEIIGDVYDETDTEEAYVKKKGAGVYVVKGDCDVEDFVAETRFKIPESPEYNTISGYVLKYTGRILRKNETVQIKNLIFTVTQKQKNQISEFLIKRK